MNATAKVISSPPTDLSSHSLDAGVSSGEEYSQMLSNSSVHNDWKESEEFPAVSTLPPLHSIDWNAIWNNELNNHHEVTKYRRSNSQWHSPYAARRYWDRAQRNHRERIEDILRDLKITPDSRVLDIGAGPGIISIPLAKQVSHITAVDPSLGMISVLKEKMIEHGVSNIHCVQKKWEDSDVELHLMPPYDIVIASLSLDMPDIRSAVQKMVQVCSKSIYLYWFAGEPTWEERTRHLMPLLHGISYYPFPKCDILFNVLYQMGIYPHMSKSSYDHIESYTNFEEVVTYYKNYYQVITQEQEFILQDYLKKIVQKNNNGVFIRSKANCLKIWWEKEREYTNLKSTLFGDMIKVK